MSFLSKLFERQSGLTAMQKGYSEPGAEIVQAALTGDTDEVLAIMFAPQYNEKDSDQESLSIAPGIGLILKRRL